MRAMSSKCACQKEFVPRTVEQLVVDSFDVHVMDLKAAIDDENGFNGNILQIVTGVLRTWKIKAGRRFHRSWPPPLVTSRT